MLSDAFGQHQDRTPTHGYEATREAAMAAFAKKLGAPGVIKRLSRRPVMRAGLGRNTRVLSD